MVELASSQFVQPTVGCDAESLCRRIRAALGKEAADLVLRGGQVVNVFTQQIEQVNIAIVGDIIAAAGPFDFAGIKTVDIAGRFVLPGLVDAHMHLESTLLMPAELARLVVPHGTSVIVADPHEIANVHGIEGVELLMAASENLPLSIYFMVSSCVPATAWEHAGATLGPEAVRALLNRPRVLGLAEMMNFPGVWETDADVVEKIAAAAQGGFAVDGHAPRIVGRPLAAYAAAGIRSDHESVTLEEGLEKARLGMLVQIREGSSARNLDAFLPGLCGEKLGDWCLATDDIHPDDIIAHGHIDGLLRRIVAAGVPAPRAVRHATLVPARHYGLRQHGAVAPSYRADLFVVDDLTNFHPVMTVHAGKIVSQNGSLSPTMHGFSHRPANSVKVGSHLPKDLAVRVGPGETSVIGIVPNQIVTRHLRCNVVSTNGQWEFDPLVDLSMIACVERHRRLGTLGVGLVQGFGFGEHGAFASTVAHDSHNIVVAGTNGGDMVACIEAMSRMGGGFVVVKGGKIVAELPLPVAGLISVLDGQSVASQLESVRAAARSLGCKLPCPFGTLSFLALPVIPELKITDQGIFDVVRQQFVEPLQ